MTLSPRQVRELLSSHDLAPSRALGQNFVADPNTVRRIAALAEVGPGDRVVEVGPGLGSLTLALAETGASVVAVEIDRHLVPVLRSVVEPVGVRVVQGDARKVDWSVVLADPAADDDAKPDDADAKADGDGDGDDGTGAAAKADDANGEGGGPDRDEAVANGSWALVANLPYNIATPLVLDLLAGVPAIGRMLVMVQREVGERLAARVGDAAYGIPSVKVAYWGVASVVGRVPATVFVPQPKVESALVRIVRHPGPPPGVPEGVDRERLFRLVDAGFGQRRKMLRRSLAGRVDADAFAAAGVRPEARAEELDLAAWSRLTSAAATMEA